MRLAVALALLAGASLALPVGAGADSFLPSAELVSVSDTGFTATWTTATASDTTLCVDAQPCRRLERSEKYHYAHAGGLKPGTHHTYSLMSNGQAELPSPTNPGSFTTLTRPSDRHLFDFALLSDTHNGEGCSGTAVTLPDPIGSEPPCFSSAPGDPPYAAAMSQDAVHRVNAHIVDLALIDGDLTSSAKLGQAKLALGEYRAFDIPWHAVRGNHDRPAQNDPDPRCGADNDCFRSVFFPGRAPGRIFFSFDFRGVHFIGLDSSDAAGLGDLTDPAQNAWLKRDLDRAKRRSRPTFIYFHHPVAEYANATALPPVVFGVRPDKGGTDFLNLLAGYPNVVGVLNGHTHRNYVAYAAETGARLPFIETSATKEYPTGFSVFHVYEGGYMRVFKRLSCHFCRIWTSTTRGEYFGLYPLYTLGPLSTRNFTHVYGCPNQSPPQSPPGGVVGQNGGDTAPAC
jgi:Icc protein